MTTTVVPVVLAGGSGTRLWPLSRESYPKQFLNLIGKHSLLQDTLLRAGKLASPNSELLVVTNDAHYFICQDQVAEIGFSTTSVKFLLEPCVKNTAPAIATAACYVKERFGPDAVMVVFPSDHFIEEDLNYSDSLVLATELASQNFLVTLGIVPTSAQVGYGYIEVSPEENSTHYAVRSFKEKPEQALAETFLAAGNFYWNSGMFAFTAGLYLAELEKTSPAIHAASANAYQAGVGKADFFRIDRQHFEACPSDSIDYAVMEKTDKARMVPLKSAWSDLGCWSSVAAAGVADENNNVLRGNVIANQTQGCFISSEKRLVTTLGLQNTIVITTDDAILVADKQYAQQVKSLVEQLRTNSNHLAKDHQKVLRPWGYYESLAVGTFYQVKHLMVKPGAQLSLQKHEHRAEHWVVVSGVAHVVNADREFTLLANQSTFIAQGDKHRLANFTEEPLHVIEVQSGSYLGEDDIVRFEDIYQRVVLSEEA